MLLIMLCFAVLSAFIIYSSQCIPFASNALLNCISCVIPSIFPFLVITDFLGKTEFYNIVETKTKKIAGTLFYISGTAFSVVIFGYLCGFPGAAKITGDLYKQNRISLSDAIRLSAFTNNAGPLFIIGTIGFGMLNSVKTGIILFMIQCFSSLLTGLIISKSIKLPKKNTENFFTPHRTESFLKNITDSITASFMTMIPITGTIVFFAFISKAFATSGLLNPLFSFFKVEPELSDSLIFSFFELTGGLSTLVSIFHSEKLLLPILSLFISWSGLSIHMQVLNFYSNADIPIKYYFIGKFMTMIISFVLATIYIL